MSGPLGSSARLPLGIVRQIDSVCDAYAAALDSGGAPNLEPYLEQIDQQHRDALLDALVGVELDHLESRGALDPRSEVLQRHAQLKEQIVATRHFGTVAEGDASRVGAAGGSSRQGLSLRCPHCRERFEVVSQAPLAEIVCSRCGSAINLLGPDDPPNVTPDAEIGHFKLIERLGMGSFGTVWRARDVELDRDVALKIPRKGQLDPDERRLFLREARSAAQLNHAHIVSVHEVGIEDDQLFIVSDLVQGQTLSERLKTGTLSQREAATLCATIADALAHAHQQGVIHRDLKPQNIMLDGHGTPYIMDFGLAKRIKGEATMTLEGRLVGTPAYMSPEQAKVESLPADARSDVYSLGVILFQLLTGQLPFRGSTPAILQQVVHVEAPDPRSLNRQIDRDLAAICRRCLEKDPASRYQAAAALYHDLERYLRGIPVEARTLSPQQRAWRWYLRLRRERNLRIAAAGVLIAMLVGIISLLAVRRLDRLARDADARATTQAADLRSLEYVNQITAAYSAYEQGWAGQTRRMLGAIEERFFAEASPDFAWRLLDQLSRPPVPRQIGVHPGGANELVVFPDGQRLASVGGDGLVRIWDVHDGQLLESYDFGAAMPEIDLTAGGMHSIALSPDGRYLAAGADVVGLLDLKEGRAIRKLFHADYNVESLCFSADGDRIAAAVRYEEIVLLQPDGTILARLPSFPRGTSLQYLPVQNLWIAPHVEQPKGRTVVRILTKDFQSVAHPLDSQLSELVHPSVTSIDPTGRRLAASSDGRSVRVFNLAGATASLTTPVYREAIRELAWSPDGRMLAIGYFNGMIRCHRFEVLANGRLQLSALTPTFLASDEAVRCIRFVADDTIATAGPDGAIKLWKPFQQSNRAAIKPNLAQPQRGRFSPLGKHVALTYCSLDAIALYDAREGRRIAQRSLDEPYEIGWVPGGEELLVRPLNSRQLHLFSPDLETRRTVDSRNLIHGIGCSTATPMFASIDQDEILLYSSDAATPIDRFRLEETGRRLAFSPDGTRLAYGGAPPLLGICETADLSNSTRFSSPANVTSLGWSPDGAILASGHTDGIIRLWNARRGSLRQELVGHREMIGWLCFCQDGRTLISRSYDGTSLWRTDLGRRLGHIPELVLDVAEDDRKALVCYPTDATPRFPTTYIETLNP